MADPESLTVTRTVPAGPDTVFALLADPSRHQETEPGDWVRSAVDTAPLTEVGQVFAVNMFLERAGGDYVMHNRVTVLEPGRAIGWEPGQLAADGQLEPGGWTWRYDLAPDDQGTAVTLTYDWTRTPQEFRDWVGGMPPFPPSFLGASLKSLERALT